MTRTLRKAVGDKTNGQILGRMDEVMATGVKQLDKEIELLLPTDAESFQLTISCTEPFLARTIESKVAATLLTSMKAGRPVHASSAIEKAFSKGLDTIQDIFATWHSDLERVPVHAETVDPSPVQSSSSRKAAFFTGGVDSYYTLLKHQSEIDTLVYVHGFDVELTDLPMRNRVSAMVHEVGLHFTKEVIECSTNLREYSDPVVDWPRYHGAALATIGLALQDAFSTIFIPSSFPYNHLRIWGSHPLLDPCWSTSRLTFQHDGCEANRLEKCRYISESSLAMKQLRVCWENTGGSYNCGRCEKCIRTMIQLLAVGKMDCCSAFEQDLDPAPIARNSAIQSTVRRLSYQYEPALAILRDQPEFQKLVHILDRALAGPTLGNRIRSRVGHLGRAVRSAMTADR